MDCAPSMRTERKPPYQNDRLIAVPSQAKEHPAVSLSSIVSRGATGRFSRHQAASSELLDPRDRPSTVWLSGASMRFLEAGLAVTAIATALIIGIGR
jgi:hypothetical protein